MKPMLAGKCTAMETLRYPVLVSPKLDGVRALVISGKLMSRSLKPIPNAYAQKLFANLPTGTDGELIVGSASDDPYRRTVSAVMSEDGEPSNLCYHVFDNFTLSFGFNTRFQRVMKLANTPGVVIVPHYTASNDEELTEFEHTALSDGFEGLMIRALDGPYKQGRSTEKEGYLLKLKRFSDAEAVVIDTEELMHNANEATKDALGHTARSSHQENLVGMDRLGALNVRGIGGTYDGVEFSIGTGFDALDRIALWQHRTKLHGRIAKFKFFPTGSKGRPRFPVFLGWREAIDL